MGRLMPGVCRVRLNGRACGNLATTHALMCQPDEDGVLVVEVSLAFCADCGPEIERSLIISAPGWHIHAYGSACELPGTGYVPEDGECTLIDMAADLTVDDILAAQDNGS